MINALVLFDCSEGNMEELRAKSLRNAKQLICGSRQNEVIVDLAATTVEDLHTAIAELATVEGVERATVVRVAVQR
jgi:hypothetical protein